MALARIEALARRRARRALGPDSDLAA